MQGDASPDAPTAPEPIDARHLRSALEFAVTMAREGQKIKPPLKYPAALRKFIGMARIPAAALPPLRRAVEADPTFRGRIAVGAIPELVDPIGRLWLARPEGWLAELQREVVELEEREATATAAAELRRSEKRRQAAEQALARVRAEVIVLTETVAERDASIDELRGDVAKLGDRVDELRTQLHDVRAEARHARDREAAANAKFDAALSERRAAAAGAQAAEAVRDDVLADRAALAAERSELARLAAMAESLASQMASLSAPPTAGRGAAPRRTPLALPGGVLGTSTTAVEHLLRSGASVLIDGYNVSKSAWPTLDLASQRVVLLDASENLAKRYGSDITVVFDGAGVVGAAGDRRRVVRVVFSPDDVIADDVIRDEVRRLPATRPVVVVTSDQQIVRDVRAMGANTVASDQLMALVRG